MPARADLDQPVGLLVVVRRRKGSFLQVAPRPFCLCRGSEGRDICARENPPYYSLAALVYVQPPQNPMTDAAARLKPQIMVTTGTVRCPPVHEMPLMCGGTSGRNKVLRIP